MKIILVVASIVIAISGCSKMQEKKQTEEKKPDVQTTPGNQMPNESSGENKSTQADDRAAELVKIADESIAKYASGKSEENKSQMVKHVMEAANYLMFDANLPAREKYRPALRYYRKVLEVDPENVDAAKNKKQIEDIYESMGMPIPQ